MAKKKLFLGISGTIAIFISILFLWYGFLSDALQSPFSWEDTLPDKGSAIRAAAQILNSEYPTFAWDQYYFEAEGDFTNWSGTSYEDMMDAYRTWRVYTIRKDQSEIIHGGGVYAILNARSGELIRYGIND